MPPPPLFTVDDDWWFATLASLRDPVSGLTAGTDPPYAPYLSNSNQDTALGSPFAADLFHNRWYGCRAAFATDGNFTSVTSAPGVAVLVEPRNPRAVRGRAQYRLPTRLARPPISCPGTIRGCNSDPTR
jgi:hypothetical protein